MKNNYFTIFFTNVYYSTYCMRLVANITYKIFKNKITAWLFKLSWPLISLLIFKSPSHASRTLAPQRHPVIPDITNYWELGGKSCENDTINHCSAIEA